jgi:activator of HSP90 ATPase
MSKESISLEIILNTSADQFYKDWLTSETHSDFTGGEAKTSDKVGADFSAWDGYIAGKNIELTPGKKIVQSWRTVEFNENDEDSIIELEIEAIGSNESKLTLHHKNIPAGAGEKYKTGWEEHYLEPMTNYYLSR